MRVEEIDELLVDNEAEEEEEGDETDLEDDLASSVSLLTDCLDLMEGLMDRKRRNIIGKRQHHKLRELSAEVRGFLAAIGELDVEGE